MTDLTPEEEAQLPVLRGAWAFLTPVAEGDFARGWPAVDPHLRGCWSQEWLHANAPAVEADGYDREQVLAEFQADRPDHPLWHHFVRVYQRSVLGVLDDIDPQNWGIGLGERVVETDVKVLYLHDLSRLPGGVWQPGEQVGVHPILMRRSGLDWRVYNVNSEIVPEPGWPPRLY